MIVLKQAVKFPADLAKKRNIDLMVQKAIHFQDIAFVHLALIPDLLL